MLRLKCCPKCKGDVLLDKDHYGWYEQCLQCGYLRDLETIVQVEQQPDRMEKKRRQSQTARDKVDGPGKDFCLSGRV
jgi:hypothetical protein